MTLVVLPQSLSIARLAPDVPIPQWATGAFLSIIRTPDETSIICESLVPADVRCERGFRAIRIVGTIAFDQVGVIASISRPLADASLPIFVISTFDTDYILVRESQLDLAVQALQAAQFHITSANSPSSDR